MYSYVMLMITTCGSQQSVLPESSSERFPLVVFFTAPSTHVMALVFVGLIV